MWGDQVLLHLLLVVKGPGQSGELHHVSMSNVIKCAFFFFG